MTDPAASETNRERFKATRQQRRHLAAFIGDGFTEDSYGLQYADAGLLLRLLERAADLGCEPGVNQRQDTAWSAHVHDPKRKAFADAYEGVAMSPIAALVIAICKLQEATDG